MKKPLLLVSLIGFILVSCNKGTPINPKQYNNTNSIDVVTDNLTESDIIHTKSIESENTILHLEPTLPQINSWKDAVNSLGKNYKVIGIWNQGYSNMMIYSYKGKYYKAACRISSNPINHNNADLLKKKSKNTYICSYEDSDMPEKYIISSQSLDTYAYNPDGPYGGEWVYMGAWNKVY